MATKQGTYRPFEVPDEREIVYTDKLRFPWREDKAGYFLIKVEGKEIQCGFLQKDKMTVEFRGEDPFNMIKEIAKRDLVNPEHLGYVAAELTLAKQCIDTGKPYVQR